MPIISPTDLKKSYDVIVVGSGAGGGQAVYTLTLEGAKVLLIEAGRNYVPETESAMFQTPDQAPLRDAGTPDKTFGFYDAIVDGGWTVPGEPYLTGPIGAGGAAEYGPNREFEWFRARMLGGRTNHWGRVSLRNGPYDFKPYSRDGLGVDWPISYADLAPYYDKVEMLIGVCGSNDGLENTPDSPPGCLLPPPKPIVSDLLIQQRAKRLGIPVVAVRAAIMTQQLDFARLPAKLHPGNPFAQKLVAESMQRRAACFYATPCYRGCSIRATYQSTTVHLPPAMASGNLDLLCNAMAREVTLGKNGKASGVSFIDKTTGREGHASARVVVLAASSMESVRLLLNSKSASFPHGLGNSSGLLGKYIMDTPASEVAGQIPLLENLPPHNEEGISGNHTYAPWWLHQEQLAGKLGFPRGYHIQFEGCGRRMPSLGTASGLEWLTGGSYGHRFKEDARRYYGSFVEILGLGEMIPNEECYCEIDPEKKDKWGIPVLRFHWKWSEHELRQVAHQLKTFAAIIDEMGGTMKGGGVTQDSAKAITSGGSAAHEVGGARMGDNPAKSVTNQWAQLWDVPNVVLADGAPFASSAHKNPTLTIMALAWRTTDHIASELKKMNL